MTLSIIDPATLKVVAKMPSGPDPHEVEARIARAHLPQRVIDELNATRALLDKKLDDLSDAMAQENAPLSPAVAGGLRANLSRRLDRFERRLIVAAKKEHADIMLDISTARGSLYPFGKPQERSLNFVPLLARYGPGLRDDMLGEARAHAKRLVGENSPAPTLEEAATARGRS